MIPEVLNKEHHVIEDASQLAVGLPPNVSILN